MLQFEIPQFIDIEDHIIGPFTLKQFAFVGTGVLLDVALFRIFKFTIPFFFLAFPITLLALVISFGKFNGRRVYNIVPIFIKFISSPKIYIYSRRHISPKEVEIQPIVLNPETNPEEPEEAQSKLRRLSTLLEQKNQEEYKIVNGPR